uniref:Ribonuclease H-like domain-containing protein n=1 Tax=Tanacetum cinerariifolium TaxID=118510 RepID=A0A6L2JE31_TANCI|nr:ribonuclease H-like domain-containing protein [Tanacetum cinerariifolium]
MEEHSFIAIIHQKTTPDLLQFCLFSCFLSQEEPKKIFDALKDPSWVEAMKDELLQFKIQNVWILVDCPKGIRPISTKWVLKNRKDERGIVIRNKARLVVQGYTYKKGIDYKEFFAPVARIEAIRLILAYASFTGFTPPGFQDPKFLNRVYKVEKAMYGLHQAPRAWYGTLSKYLLDNGFQRGTIDKTLFIRKHKGEFLLVQVHQVTPKECHLYAFKRIFRYLKGHPKLGLWHPKESPFDLVAYSNSDYGGATQDRKSTTGEYVAAASGCGQVPWIQNQMLDYGNLIMSKLAFCDYHNMIAILEKIEHNINFHQIVDFIEASHIRYALTINPTVYVSHIRQFWSTARIETTNEETKILATVDGKPRTISESSPRRHLKLNDDVGISSLPDKELFENLSLMGYNILPNQRFTFQKRKFSHQWKQYSRRATQIAQSKALSPAADEPASLLRDDIQGEALPTVTSLDAGQDRKNIIKTSDLPHESSPRVTSVDANEHNLEISGLKATVKILKDKDRGRAKPTQEDALIKRGSMEIREEVRVERSTELGTVSVSPVAAATTIGVPTVKGLVPTRLSEQLTRDSEIARLHAEEELKMMIEGLDKSNEMITKHLNEYEQAAADLTIRENIELINELRNDIGGIKEKFIPVWKQIKDFVPMSSKEEGERMKRKGLKLDQESAKKMKTSEDVSKEDLKGMMQLVPLEEVKLLGSQITDKSKNGLGFQSYNVVPPPATLVYNTRRCPPPKTNLSYSGLEEFKQPQFKSYGPKSCEKETKNSGEDIPNELKEYPNAPLVKDRVSDNKDCSVESLVVVEKKTDVPTISKVEFVRPKEHEKPVKKPVKYAKMYMAQGQIKLMLLRPQHVGFRDLPNLMGHPQKVQEDQGYVNNGYSRHMIGNMSYFYDFKEFDRRYVTLGGGANGGRITGKGTLKIEATLDESMLWHRRLGKAIQSLFLMHKTYGLVVTDDCSRYTWVFFLATKNETTDILMKFITEVENLVDKKVKVIRCDNGTELMNSFMNDFCAIKGIRKEFSVAKTPQQNGFTKRRNRTLNKVARTMLADSKLPTTFWTEAVNTACYVQNRALVVKPYNKTPYELFRGRTHALSFMRPFWCHVTILNTLDHLGKFDVKADEGYFVGYFMNSKAYTVYNIRTRRVEENLHIEFLKNTHIVAVAGPKWLFDIDMLTKACCCMFIDEKVYAVRLKLVLLVLIKAQHQISNESPLLGVNTPRWDEDSLEIMELIVFLVLS